ncbi:lytic transglycosylase domain-containing protein [Pelagibius litoralis]|uniref:lytic transglycosylase domain-containing protein n=1 Tax=Pelagibius litoralis TaxID=374515 RepID=UPI002AC33EC7|nr:lytic transglycosylase domain-containing protein [Pelagibius litoralis]
MRAFNLTAAAALALALIALATASGTARATEAFENTWTLCRASATAAEQAYDLPPLLLSAIGRTESGRRNPETREILAWPWTVMAEGKGRFLPSKKAAIETVEALRARGVRNIDVGCMQVNLHHHPEAFEDLETAFDPARNTAYAAAFLAGLREEARSWTRAVGHYHSRTILRANGYRAKVFKAWRAERHRANRERRAALKAAREAARAKG